MIARLTLWDSIGASRDPLDVFPVRLAPASPPGLSFTLCLSAGTESGGKCGVGRLATRRRLLVPCDKSPARRVPVAAGAITFAVQPMPIRRQYRRPNPDRRRALELLAGSRYGYTKAILRAHGFSIDMMVELVKAGLATTKRERMVADGRQTGVVRVRITDAGRQALARMSK
jgi:hypothetical protein